MLLRDRRDAGKQLARLLEPFRGAESVVVGLPRGGVVVAAEVASELGAPLDTVAVRKVGHPLQPEYALGAVTAGGGVYVRSRDGVTEDQLADAIAAAVVRAEELDKALHAASGPVPIGGKTVILVDDGLATGATMLAAVRWAREAGAARVVAAVPVAAAQSAAIVRKEADELLCLHELERFWSVGSWYERFDQVEDEEVIRLLAAGHGDRPDNTRGEDRGGRGVAAG